MLPQGAVMTGLSPVSIQIWEMKYRFTAADGSARDATVADSFQRVARALAAAELPESRQNWERQFFRVLSDFRFLPAGRILAGAGTGRQVTLFNCFVMGTIPDDMGGIFAHLREAALTMQQGGGIGYDFSTLRPRGALVRGVGADASGPLSYMDVWDGMCRTIMSAGSRRGAMMATMRCDHPDIEQFVAAKRDPSRLRMFNLSVLVTDAFMMALRSDENWDLVFDGKVYRSLPARQLWDGIMRATYDYAEPGVIFIDRVNELNNLHYCETIAATNPCGEQPLPPYGACLLGSVNLARLVHDPFSERARLDERALDEIVMTAVRMMDNVVDVSRFPLPAQAEEARLKRRLGLGVTGLADALVMCRIRYDSAEAVRLTEKWLKRIETIAYLTSAALSAEKGAFPLFDRDAFLNGRGVAHLEPHVKEAIARHGLRNALLTSIAPTGTISLLADNVSSGIEPIFSLSYTRRLLMPDGMPREEQVSDYAYRLFRTMHGEDAPLPDYFVTAQDLKPSDHIAIQSAAQKHIDASISKTVNVPASISFDEFKNVYMDAYERGLKGCTTYRPNEVTGAVLTASSTADADSETKPVAKTDMEQTRQSRAPENLPLLSLAAPADRASARPQMGTTSATRGNAVVYISEPLERAAALPGFTYKLRWPESDHALYITLNDIIQDGRRRPFEIFINSKNMEHYAWTVALTRMISAVFRRGGDVSFVVEELKAVFDPRGGQWLEGRYVPSLLAAIGEVIENHMVDIGFLSRDAMMIQKDRAARSSGCPRCGLPTLTHQEGCDTCLSCGYSRCA
jgi:ribonucleoside-diphosphate reductase alpha chain